MFPLSPPLPILFCPIFLPVNLGLIQIYCSSPNILSRMKLCESKYLCTQFCRQSFWFPERRATFGLSIHFCCDFKSLSVRRKIQINLNNIDKYYLRCIYWYFYIISSNSETIEERERYLTSKIVDDIGHRIFLGLINSTHPAFICQCGNHCAHL